MREPDARRAVQRCDRIRAMIVDDEPLARSNVRVLLLRDSQVDIVRECGSGAEAITHARSLKPDLLFLDVEMPECDGFDVLEMLGCDAPPAIVFVTAYDTYAVRAFAAEAVDYLVKPFDDARFVRGLERAKARIAAAPGPQRAPSAIAVKSAGRLHFIKIADIEWIEAADYYSRLHTGTKTYLVRRSMAELERDLDPATFCRIHRCAMVRVDRVRGIELNANGDYDAVLDNGTALRSSRRYRKRLVAALRASETASAPRRSR